MAIDCTSVPPWLKVMRAITGITEEPGSADNPKILGMRDWIACTYDDMVEYCEGYDHDDTPWCGLTAAFAMTVAGIRPPFGPTDTDRWLWALAWADDPNYQKLDEPVPGCIVVMEREGGGHVTFYESTSGSNYKCRGGNQSDEINVSSYAIDTVVALVWPRGVPLPVPAPSPGLSHDTVKEGDSGEDVEEVQRILGIPIDGEFGGQTESAVQGFQAAMDLDIDGEVGPATWDELDKLDRKMKAGNDGLDSALKDKIVGLAAKSEIAQYDWEDRGQAPPGYIPGMALCFALAMLEINSSAVKVMAQADTNDTYNDALTWYANEFDELNMNNNKAGIDTLRHLFVLMISLGMCESSGNHWEGRDESAENTSPDSAEAGLMQSSWDLHSSSPEIVKLFNYYWDDPNGFAAEFSEELEPRKASCLENYGHGDRGTQYQWLAKFCPAFAVMMAAVGLRVNGGEEGHYGPVRRKEIELRQDADYLLRQVQRLVEQNA
jgi:uncharacterized protein (TIGR02594 family)